MKTMYGREGAAFKAVSILRLLMEGAIIEDDGRKWVLTEDGRLAVWAYDENGNPKTDENGNQIVLFVWDDSLQDFIAWADDIPEEAIAKASAELVLRAINQAGGLSAWGVK